MLAILDSGTGGLSVLRRVRQHYPKVDILYFADQANAPLGTRDTDTLYIFLDNYISYLKREGVELLAMGSNTLCAVARVAGWPSAPFPIVDILQAAIDEMLAHDAAVIGIVATAATVKTRVFSEAARTRAPARRVLEVSASELVPLVERGTLEGAEVRSALRDIRQRFEEAPQMLVFACTHFPFLEDAFRQTFTETKRFIDPAESVALRLARSGIAARIPHRGRIRFVTTGSSESFRAQIERLYGPLAHEDIVEHVDSERVHARRVSCL